MRSYPVIEIFGPVIQGEGLLTGVKTHFIRFGGCDFRCSWCDTMYAVIPIKVKQNSTLLTGQQIMDKVQELNPAPWITLSGGNPCMHELGELPYKLSTIGKVNVETQGSLFAGWLNDCELVTVSPKPPSSGQAGVEDKLREFLLNLRTKRVFKIVVFDDRDYDWAKRIFQEYSKGLPCYLQAGTNIDPKLRGAASRNSLVSKYRWLTEKVVNDPEAQNYIVSLQMHSLIYGQRRGV